MLRNWYVRENVKYVSILLIISLFYSMFFLPFVQANTARATGYGKRVSGESDRGFQGNPQKILAHAIKKQRISAAPSAVTAPSFGFTIDPTKRTVKAIKKRRTSVSKSAIRSASSLDAGTIENQCLPEGQARMLVPCTEDTESGCSEDAELWQASYAYELQSNNSLEIRASFKNVTNDKTFHQPFCFTVNEETTLGQIEIITLPTPESLSNTFGADVVLHPGETTTVLTFRVKHKGKKFSFLVDANAVVEEIAEPSPTPCNTPLPSPTPVDTPTPTPNSTPSPTVEPTPTGAPSPTSTPTLLPTPTATPTPTPTPTPTVLPTPSPSPTPTPEVTPTHTPTPTLPPDPADVAPELDLTIATTMGSATAFLYTGENPIQTGVGTDTIKAYRCAVLRGKVLDKENQPLRGVTMTILSHPEFGQTLSRADGMFDMAVNGGGLLTVNYKKEGYLPAQRQVDAPWEDYAWLPDVVMIPVDPQVATIDLSASVEMQVAQGSTVEDDDGIRTATILFPAGTSAEMVLPDGTTQPLTSLNVRATEYTVGENGPENMPAPLPPQVGYTYCVEMSVDEALSAGATDVQFNQPLYFYVDNFLNFPVGISVPSGYYDRGKGQWIPSDNGRIIKIVSITGGRADIDTDGDDAADNDGSLGITDEERGRLGSLYTTGQSLWRVPIKHFTPWDANWPFGPPDDAVPPEEEPPEEDENQCLLPGSIIGVQKQTLGEETGITGTPFNLHYQSDRVPGRKTAYSLNIPLSGTSIPASLKSIELEVTVAGRIFTESFAPAPNLTHLFTWDGNDAYGRTVQGTQPVTVRIGYTYQGVYQQVERFGYNGNGIPITGDQTREEVTLWQEWKVAIGIWNNLSNGLGHWCLDVNHSYNPSDGSVYYGNGTSSKTKNKYGDTISSISGGVGDGGQVTAAKLLAPEGIVIGNDGSVYFADTWNHRIRRVGTDGIITTVAGNGSRGFSGDGGQATAASLNVTRGIALGSDGTIYIADSGNSRIRRVGTDGIITTVAGTGNQGFSGDGGLATEAMLFWPEGIEIGSDGNIYIADTFNHRIRRVGTDGIITTVVGNGGIYFGGDGDLAIGAMLTWPVGIAIGNDGSIYIADMNNNRIRRIDTAGIITTVAGNGNGGFSGDGDLATAVSLYKPRGVAIRSDGSIYIADTDNHRIRRVDTDGIITTVAGNGNGGFGGDGGQATEAMLNYPGRVAIGNDGSIYIADTFNHRIRRVGTDGIITTVAGNGQWGFSGDGDQATVAMLSAPEGIVIGNDGSIYIADAWNYRIRRVGPDGIITTVAGNGNRDFGGDGGRATEASLNVTRGIAIGGDGSIYIADSGNSRIRRVGPDGTSPPWRETENGVLAETVAWRQRQCLIIQKK